MAQFTNQATLTYNNTVVNSNVAVGELLEVLSATKLAVVDSYTQGDDVTYIISILNSGNTPITGISVSDDLGAYAVGGTTVTPLSYVDGSIRLYAGGVLQASPTTTAGPPLVFGGITIPAKSNVMLVYETRTNGFAPPNVTGSLTNTATITGGGLTTPVLAESVITPRSAPNLTITKSLEPTVVAENSTLTYRFVIQNFGNTAAETTDAVAVTDTFSPVLSGIVVMLNGATLAEYTDYTYDETTGVFATIPGQITIPAATFTQDPTTGVFVTTPGAVTLAVTGTV